MDCKEIKMKEKKLFDKYMICFATWFILVFGTLSLYTAFDMRDEFSFWVGVICLIAFMPLLVISISKGVLLDGLIITIVLFFATGVVCLLLMGVGLLFNLFINSGWYVGVFG
jgi:hypothetical protein